MDYQKDYRVAADVGGTFTDVVTFNEETGQSYYGKTLTTPNSLVEGIITGVDKSGTQIGDTKLFLHGTTVAINILLERDGAKTALITTQGFRDIYEIGRINRPDAYNLHFQKHQPLISRSLRFEVAERMAANGEILIPLNENSLVNLAVELKKLGVQAVAILFLHSYANPQHELRAKEILEGECPSMFVTASHELSNEYREYERTSTVAANAYIGPRVKTYLSEIDDRLAQENFQGKFYIVQSTGGLSDISHAQRECIKMLESGPAAGVIGTQALCQRLLINNAIAFDMGGTTAKAGVVLDGEVVMAGDIMIGGYAQGLPIMIPLIDIQEVGTGGGSIARVEVGGGLRVGPKSSGAMPGPVCYSLGGEEITVTDANLILGRITSNRFLGGEMLLDLPKSTKILRETIADPLGISETTAADGIIQIAVTTMSHVVRRVTTERGLDAGDFSMVAYGGAGPLHACLVARELRIPRVIIPPSPGHFSAYGMLMADLRRDFVQTWFKPLAKVNFEEIEKIYASMESNGIHALEGDIKESADIVLRRGADMRYMGQEHSVKVDLPIELFKTHDLKGIKRQFDEMHLKRYAFNAPNEPVDIVSLHSSVIGILQKPPSLKLPSQPSNDISSALIEMRKVYFSESGGYTEIPVYSRNLLPSGSKIKGPVLIEEYASTTVVPPGDDVLVNEYGDLIIDIYRGV